jgi:ribosome modulation factor
MTQKQLIEDGYQSGLSGKPCEAPTSKERDRAAWEQGWRAGHRDRNNPPRDHRPLSNGRSVWRNPEQPQ